MTDFHNHPCPRCGWNFPCTCAAPDQHHGFCFECAPPPLPSPQPQHPSLAARWDLRDDAVAQPEGQS